MLRILLALGVIGFLAACGGGDGGVDAGEDAADDNPDADTNGDGDARGDDSPDADADAGGDDGGDAGGDEGGDVDPGAEMVIEQIYLTGFMGEGALVIGPDGTSVLIDVGNDSHADEVIEAIDRRIGRREVDWVIITHYHADHDGGFDKLFLPSSYNDDRPVVVTHGVVSRGLFDIDGQFTADDSDLQQFCELIKQPMWDGKRFDLCSGPAEASCDGSGGADPWAASGCPGLLLGDLADPGDDQAGRLTYIELGSGARIVFYHANGHVATGTGIESAEDSGINLGHGGTGPENSRSLGGVLRWGSFMHTFHGDLTDTVEEYITGRAARIVDEPGGGELVPSGSIDTLHLSHHGLRSATSQAWVDWLVPDNGSNRNAVVGTNSGYFLSPSAMVMERLGPRIQNGYIWVTKLGSFPGEHAKRRVAEGAVVIRVTQGGDAYEVFALTSSGPSMLEQYTSTAP